MLSNIIRNPKLLVTLIGAVIALLVAAGIDVSPELRDAISGLALAIIAIVAGATATPNGDVAATTVKGEVKAGPAHELPTGTPVVVAPAPAPGETTAAPVAGDYLGRHVR